MCCITSSSYTSKGLCTCIHDIAKGVVNVISNECCGDSLIKWLWEWGGAFEQILNLGIWMSEENALRYAGELSKTRRPLNAARLLDFTCSFQTSLHWQDFLPHYSTWLRTLIAAMCIHTQCLSVFSRMGSQWLTQEPFWLGAVLALMLSLALLSYVLVKQSVIIHLQHCDMWQEQCLFPNCQWSSTCTSFFFLPSAFQTYLKDTVIKGIGEVHSMWELPSETGIQMQPLLHYSMPMKTQQCVSKQRTLWCVKTATVILWICVIMMHKPMNEKGLLYVPL